MNPFLIEPYNAHQKPPKKKHWMEILEEEALFHRMAMEAEARNQTLRQSIHEQAIREHMALREANYRVNNQNLALPQQAPQPPSQQVQDGQYAANAGGGGWVLPIELEPFEEVNFLALPILGIGPSTVNFVNLMRTPENDTFFWTFGSGSLTSTLASPPDITYYNTGSYIITLSATSSTGHMSYMSRSIIVAAPTLTSIISATNLLSVGPTTASFTGSYTYNGSGNVSGSWNFGDNTTLAFTASQAFTHIYNTGSYTASLMLIESSYGLKNTASVYISASIP